METNAELATSPVVAAKEDNPSPVKKFYTGYVPYGVTSFAQLEEVEQAQEAVNELMQMSWAFLDMMENIIWDSQIDNKASAITQLASELIVRVNQTLSYAKSATLSAEQAQEFATVAPAALKETNFAIRKGADGKFYAYGKPSNNFIDRDGEILTEDAHKEFVTWLQENPDQMPELWDWHDEDFKCANHACWVDYADNSLHMVWELTEAEAERYNKASREFDLAMSHGFYPLMRDAKHIKQYRMIEASVLPREYCANTLTDFSVEETDSKMFTPEKRKFLVTLHGEEHVARLEAENEKAAAKARADLEHKSIDSDFAEAGEAAQEIAFDAQAAFAELTANMNTLAGAVATVVAQLTPADSTAPEPEAEIADDPADDPEAKEVSPTPLMSLLSALKQLDPTEGNGVKSVNSKNPLAKAAPAVTPPQPASGLVGFAQFLQNADQYRVVEDAEKA